MSLEKSLMESSSVNSSIDYESFVNISRFKIKNNIKKIEEIEEDIASIASDIILHNFILRLDTELPKNFEVALFLKIILDKIIKSNPQLCKDFTEKDFNNIRKHIDENKIPIVGLEFYQQKKQEDIINPIERKYYIRTCCYISVVCMLYSVTCCACCCCSDYGQLIDGPSSYDYCSCIPC